jgi:hypothetical protein
MRIMAAITLRDSDSTSEASEGFEAFDLRGPVQEPPAGRVGVFQELVRTLMVATPNDDG